MNVLIIGGSGMLGSQCIDYFSSIENSKIYSTCRSSNKHLINLKNKDKIVNIDNVDVLNFSTVINAIEKSSPDLVINCAGAIKQKDIGVNPVDAICINGLFPHKLADAADKYGFKLVLVSTDCVFNGNKGSYTEKDASDCFDIYGKSKFIGEISDKDNVLTIRTSIIGIEHSSSLSLLSWFLSQQNSINGYKNAIYSGVPTTYLADFINQYSDLSGLYHLSSKPISKFELLNYFAEYYDHKIEIVEDSSFEIDRSLQAKKLEEEINFIQPSWQDLVTYLPKEL